MEEVATLKQELKETKQENQEITQQIETLVNMETPVNSDGNEQWPEIFLRMKPDKAQRVKSQVIDGQRYLMIPVDETEHINLNGAAAEL